ncbi:S9 family peptidase [Limosilactobacillus reuteri]|uniref:alpha/beta hydrolase family protein n=1 Tax=Limosilactobacillus reuteri TaxID=1598 RepID=UPI002B06070A|nr:S9 family peptidase [Limosilactobacillus reuteri]
MAGVTTHDLLNLSNTGALQANEQYAVMLTAQPEASDHRLYQWNLQYQTGHQSPRTLVTVNQRPGFALGKNDLLYYSTVDKQKNLTTVHEVNLKNCYETNAWRITDHQLVVNQQLANGELLLAGKHKLVKGLQEGWHDVNEVPYWSNDEGMVNETRHHLWTFNHHESELFDLVPETFDVNDFWYQDDRLFLTGVAYRDQRPFQDGLYEYRFSDHQLTKLVAPHQYRFDAVALLNNQLFTLASDGNNYGMGQNPNFYRYHDKQLDLIKESDVNIGNIVVNDVNVVGGNTTTVHNDQFYFYSTIQDHNELYRFDGTDVTKVFTWKGALNSFTFRQNELLFTAVTSQQPQQLYCFNDKTFTQLSHFNRFLEDREVVPLHELVYQDSTGRPAKGWLLYPVGYQSGQKYPAVLEVHGGPRAAYGLSFFHEMQVLANAGYFVFFTNIHGSEGQGDEYADLRGKYGQVDYNDLMSFTDAVLQNTPDVDEERLGITGGSYGGFMTNWVVGHTNHFKAAVSERSIANWSSMMISDIGPEFVTDQMDDTLTADQGMDHYWFHSPLRYVQNVKTPTLFLHSDHDYRCPIPEGYQMFQALKLQNVPTRMVVFHGSNHDLSRTGRPDQRMHRLKEVVSWFNQYLKK